MEARVQDVTIARRDGTSSWLGGLKERFTLSPINQRRWDNFKKNRRGYWSFWILIVLFFVTLFAELIANDRPIMVSYRGELLFPVLTDYPESKFGGFLAVTDYKDPVVLDEIEANGWVLWPPIRFSYDTINKDYPRRKGPGGLCLGYPAPPPWATSAPLCDAPPDQIARFNALGNTNWLGLDDQGRDVAARVIYGFRISLLFGLILTISSSVVGIAAGAAQGYFGGRVDLYFQRFLEIWSAIPYLYVLLIISSVLIPGFWTLLGVLFLFSWTALVGLVRAEFLRARNFEYVTAARALGLSNITIMRKHLLAQRDGGDADVPAVPALGVDLGAHRSRLPWARYAAGIAIAGRASAAGQAPPRGAVARHHRLLLHRDHPLAPDLHRRGGSRRLRPAQDVQVRREGTLVSAKEILVNVKNLSVRIPLRPEREPRGQDGVVPHRARRDGGARRRVGFGQDRVVLCRSCGFCPIRPRRILRAKSFSTARTCSRPAPRRCKRSAATGSRSSSRSR